MLWVPTRFHLLATCFTVSPVCLFVVVMLFPKQVITMMSSQNGRHGKKVTSELFFCTHTTANTRKQSANDICYYVASSTFSACPRISSQSTFFPEQSADISSFSTEENPFQINGESTRCAFLSLNCGGTDVASLNFLHQVRWVLIWCSIFGTMFKPLNFSFEPKSLLCQPLSPLQRTRWVIHCQFHHSHFQKPISSRLHSLGIVIN